MKRYAMQDLINWKSKSNRKPLLLQGARQVGKTWLLKEFGKLHYDNVAYLSFYDNNSAKSVFDPSYDIDTIIAALSTLTKIEIKPEKTLIILDEIQECDRALNALKFFNENAKQYHIVVAGSLLGVAINHKKISFPVGQVDFLTLYPLSFCEFLEATNNIKMAENIVSNNSNVIETIKENYTLWLKKYMLVGGMPEAVNVFIESNNYDTVQDVQRQIIQGYQNDFAKYTTGYNVAKIFAVWNSIPAQLSKQDKITKKFVYSVLKDGGRSVEYQDAIEWLQMSGLIYKIPKISKPAMPLSGYEDKNSFKIYMLDCGLLCAKAGLDASAIIEGNTIFQEFKGALTEQYVLQEIKLINNLYVGYWAGKESELDFVIQDKNLIIPIEVKASTNLQAKSLKAYIQKYNPEKSVRTSLAGYEINNGLYNIPLYMIENFSNIIRQTTD